ncbi:acyltransferase family protein [Sphingobium algorifonticola]|uniref:Acyltransferase n=1 Tax=Sphingobium algorifonticola TaxID=2008318 RepID=A0A437J558_9SPHN|nr:acyltransferase [Sphingobium algorifonticola]RVT39901.1 acyltransferase [Sphingobium algorifonticola]
MTLDEQITRTGGRPSGFDYLRIGLSCAIVCWHSVVTTYGPDFQDAVQTTGWRALIGMLVPMFFSVSGFLVAGSLERCPSMVSFIGLRVIRIYPALTVMMLFSALVVGPILTAVPLQTYFSDGTFWRYLATATGFIGYELPGLFLDNPNPQRVNGQLWTIPIELFCYIVLAGLAVFSIARRRGMFLLTVVLRWMLAIGIFVLRHGTGADRPPTGMPAILLVICFLTSVAFYLWRDRVRWNARLGIGAGVCSILLMSFPIYGDFVAPVPIAYFTIWLGLCNPPKIAILKRGDYSYAIFLYSYVVQQAYMAIGPAVQHWAINIAVALPTTAVLAALSWHYVESPALRLRKPLKSLEARWIVHRERFLPLVPGVLRPPKRVDPDTMSRQSGSGL